MDSCAKLLVFFHKTAEGNEDLPSTLQVQGLVARQVLHDGVVRVYSFASTEAHNLGTCLEQHGLAQCSSISSPLTLQNNVCVVSVEGMTCNSCVKLIESTISVVAGVSSIKVSLQFKKAFIEYNPGVVKPAQLATSIYDMGFDAEVLTIHGIQSDTPRRPPSQISGSGSGSIETTPPTTPISSSSVVIAIEGMTCSSCVENIQSNLSKERGVVSVQVSLQAKNAEITFDGSITTAQRLADAIEELGFESNLRDSSISSPTSSEGMRAGNDWNVGNLKVCHVGIDGMTCQSCISLIESVVGDLEGVVSISVSLACKEGTVEFNDATTSPSIISKAVDGMGFIVTYITG